MRIVLRQSRKPMAGHNRNLLYRSIPTKEFLKRSTKVCAVPKCEESIRPSPDCDGNSAGD